MLELPRPLGARANIRVPALHLDVHQPAITDIVVVRRGQGLDDAGLDPLPTPAGFAHAKGGDDAAQRRLARVPAAGRHRRKYRAITVGLPLQIEHAACLGRNDPLVSFDPRERTLLSKTRNGAVDEPRVALRQRVVRESPVSHVSGAGRLYEHISCTDELDRVRAAFRRAEIQRDALLPAIPRNPGGLKAERIAAGRLDLDHVGAEVGHDQSAQRARHSPREIQDG